MTVVLYNRRDSSALGATAQSERHSGSSRRPQHGLLSTNGSMWSSLSRLRPRSWMGAFLAVGFLACSVWMFLPGSASAAVVARAWAAGEVAAKKGVESAARRTLADKPLWERMDEAFIAFAERLGVTLDEQCAMQPLAQSALMYRTAWATGSITPVVAAGLIGQPLGRAMALTATSHTVYAVFKFMLAVLATADLPAAPKPNERTPNRFTSTNPTPRTSFFGRQEPQTNSPNEYDMPWRARRERTDTARRDGNSGGKAVKVTVQRNKRTVPPKWLIAVTAICGPAAGAVCAAVSYVSGRSIPLTLINSFVQGSALGTLVAGMLCFGGAGTEIAARWAVLQGVLGMPFQLLLHQSVLMVFFFVNYSRASGARRAADKGDGKGGSRGDRNTRGKGGRRR